MTIRLSFVYHLLMYFCNCFMNNDGIMQEKACAHGAGMSPIDPSTGGTGFQMGALGLDVEPTGYVQNDNVEMWGIVAIVPPVQGTAGAGCIE